MNVPTVFTRRTGSICLSCRRNLLRKFSSTPRLPFATSFQSYPLNSSSAPLPPRNAAVPETSIAHPVQQPQLPQLHETRPPKAANAKLANEPQIAIREREAQTSRREFAEQTAAPPATTTAEPAPKPKSRLRAPRRAAMNLTPAAVAHLRAMLDQPSPKLIKVGVRNRGCSGLAYHLEYVDRAGAFDETVEQDGVRVLVDSKALFSIIGSEMDWVEDRLSQRFVFRNPNIKEQCGCGESFMV